MVNLNIIFCALDVRNNKRGWIKILESFTAIMLLLGVVFLIISNTPTKNDSSYIVQEKQFEFLSGIQANASLRNSVMSVTDYTLTSSDDGFPELLKNYTLNNAIVNSQCYLKICGPVDPCEFNTNLEGAVFVKDILITNNLEKYSPRKIRLFCTR